MSNFRQFWESLDIDIRREIKAKARWENQTLSSVINTWYPELWEQIKEIFN